MQSSTERIANTVLMLAAIAIAASVVHREFMPKAAQRPLEHSNKPEFVPTWRDALPLGITRGDTSAPVTIVEFVDLECPFCRKFHGIAQEVLRKHGKEVSFVFVHYPLAIHRFALPAARAAECALTQGRFFEFVDAVYSQQDSLGLMPFGSYAHIAGVRDTAAISKCALGSGQYARIDRGKAFGDKVGVQGTPTVMINGWRYPNAPSEQEIVAAIDSLRKGRPPYRDLASKTNN